MLNNWQFSRIFRLCIGIIILIQGIQMTDYLMIMLGLYFTSLPLLNVGCCAGGSCKIKQTE